MKLDPDITNASLGSSNAILTGSAKPLQHLYMGEDGGRRVAGGGAGDQS
jgi:hypothetical protein